MARIGSVAAAPFVGHQFVSLYLGATRVPTVPGRPEWDGTPAVSGGSVFYEALSPPSNDGGSEITEYRTYIDGVLVSSGNIPNPLFAENEFDEPGIYEIAIAAGNAVGEGPRLKAIYEYAEE
jgi:hypothetical protein